MRRRRSTCRLCDRAAPGRPRHAGGPHRADCWHISTSRRARARPPNATARLSSGGGVSSDALERALRGFVRRPLRRPSPGFLLRKFVPHSAAGPAPGRRARVPRRSASPRASQRIRILSCRRSPAVPPTHERSEGVTESPRLVTLIPVEASDPISRRREDILEAAAQAWPGSARRRSGEHQGLEFLPPATLAPSGGEGLFEGPITTAHRHGLQDVNVTSTGPRSLAT